MYICKECGAEVKLNFTGDVCNISVSMNKNTNGFVSTEDIEMNSRTYECSKCHKHSKDIDKVAKWID